MWCGGIEHGVESEVRLQDLGFGRRAEVMLLSRSEAPHILKVVHFLERTVPDLTMLRSFPTEAPRSVNTILLLYA